MSIAGVGTSIPLASTSMVVRLSVHILAASVWVGGQIVLAGLLPTLRSLGPDVPRKIAQIFARLSWPAFWLLILTGFWNYAAVHGASQSSSWNAVFALKMAMVVIAGVGAFVHTRASSPRARGASAGISTLAAIAAMVLGVVIAG